MNIRDFFVILSLSRSFMQNRVKLSLDGSFRVYWGLSELVESSRVQGFIFLFFYFFIGDLGLFVN